MKCCVTRAMFAAAYACDGLRRWQDKDPQLCQIVCQRPGYYLGLREWQCKRPHRVSFAGVPMCAPHARLYDRLFEIIEDMELRP